MSNYKLEHKYVWKELTSDGLLKDPEDCGAHYERVNINDDYSSGDYTGRGFASEEIAYARLLYFKKKHEYSCPSSLVLIKEANIYEADWRK